MDLHSLKPAKGAVKKSKRIGRGQGSGRGGTSTKGHKGAKSRSGYKSKRGFEGGQMPIQMRLPKRGFKNINRVEYVAMNLDRLQRISEKYGAKELTLEKLIELGIIGKNDKMKLLAKGEISAALTVSAHAASEAAKAAIEGKGGSVTIV